MVNDVYTIVMRVWGHLGAFGDQFGVYYRGISGLGLDI